MKLNQYKYLLLLIFAVVCFCFGCSSNLTQYPEPSPNAVNGTYISNDGIYKLGDIEYQADYGTLSVPENRKKENPKIIHLPVIRIHSRTKNSNEPVFGLAGGPGQSNLSFYPMDTLLYDHDFVLVGYRGVDGSTVLDCPEMTETVENLKNILSYESLRKIGDSWTVSLENLKSSGVDINGYTMPEVIEDFETIRKIYKYDRINLLSESYGTRLAYLYGVMYPQSVHRTVMIGVNPPGGFIWDPQRTDNIIRKYSALWANDPVKSKECPDLSAAMKRVLNNIPAEWNSFSLDRDKIRVGTFGMLFHRKEAALIFDAYAKADKGDYSGLALISQGFNMLMPKMLWGDIAAKALSADINYWNEEKFNDNNDTIILGAPMTELYWKSLKYGKFNIELIADSLRVPAKSDVETLMLSGSVDVTNPPECATELLKYLRNGKQIIMSESGHVGDIRYLQLNATKGLIADYINAGIVDTSEIKYVPVNFNISMGLPGLSKILLNTARILVLLLAAGLVWLAT